MRSEEENWKNSYKQDVLLLMHDDREAGGETWIEGGKKMSDQQNQKLKER